MVRSILRCAFFALISALLPLSAAVTITISPTAATVNQKATKSFVATVSGSTLKTVTWSVIGTGNGTITTAGVYTAPAKAGTFKVRVTSKADTSKYVEATVTVPDVAISVTPSTAALSPGGAQQFSATVTGTTNTTVTWSASGGTISTSGKFTAPTTAGTYTITAKSSANTAKIATATVTVQVPATITAVSMSPTTATMNAGATQAFTATVTGTGSFSNAVSWTVTGGSANGTITTSGLYTAPVTAGTYTVVATSVANTTKSASATVTVTSISVALSPSTTTVPLGGSQTFAATVTGTSNTAVTWTCSGGSVASGGVWTAPNIAGSYTVTATSAANTTKSATATILVPVQVTVSPATNTLNQGATQQFSSAITGSGTTGVTWSCSGGTISTAGLYTAPSAAGTYTITAKSSATPQGTGTATVIVNPVGISINPTTTSVVTGGTQQFAATVTGSTNSGVSWTTTGGTISGGTFTAPSAPGTYTVSATSVQDTSKKATATITVVAPVSVSINPMTVTLTAGRGIKFGYGISGASNTNVTWSVVESNGGTVDASGNYLAPAAPGTYTVQIASVADATKTAQAKVTVVAAPDGAITAPPSVSMGATDVQASVSLQPGSTYAWSLAGGTLTAGQGTNAITFTAGTGTSLTLTCKVTNGAGDSITSTKTLPVQAVESVMVTVSPSSVTLPPGGTQLFTAVVTGTSNLNTNWGYSEGDLVQSGDGMLYTAPLTPGTYSIIVASDADDTKTATATITVQASGINVSISPSTVNLTPGASQNFTATVTGSINTQVTWSVLESGGGTIGTSGAYTAPTATGVYTIQAASKADPTKKSTAKVTVSNSTVAITIDPATITLAPGGTQLFKATVTGTTNFNTQWSYNGGTLAQSGGGMLFTAPPTLGTYTITVASAADPSRKATATICAPRSAA